MNIWIGLGISALCLGLPFLVAQLLKPKFGHCGWCGDSLYTPEEFNWHGQAHCMDGIDTTNAPF